VLALEQVDLADLALALEDHSDDHSRWFDPATGAVDPRFTDDVGDPSIARDEVQRLIRIEPLPSAVGYGDMEDFVARIREPRTRDLLERAISGRGAFRRFKDALLDYPDLRRAWFAFHDTRGERRAVDWLAEHELVEPAAAEEAIASRGEPPVGAVPGLLDAQGVAERVGRDLRRLYRDRLRGIVMIGAWARGDAHPESELELLVVLDSVSDRWQERRRMDRVMWRHSVRNDTVVTCAPVTEAELDDAWTPLLARATAEGVRLR
jgi:predicted nucleotidyltransferase